MANIPARALDQQSIDTTIVVNQTNDNGEQEAITHQVTCVKFGDSLVHTSSHPLTVLESYKSNAAYAGVHDLEVKGESQNEWFSPGFWKNFDDSIWSVSETGGIQATNASSESYIFSNNELYDPIKTPYSFVVNFEASGNGGICFRVTDEQNYYMLRWDGSRTYVDRVVNGNTTLINSIPKTIGQKSKVKLMCREFQYTSMATDVWLLIGVWFDEEMILSAADNIGTAKPKDGLGFFVESGGSISWTELYVPILSIPIDWGVLDPGESPMESIERTVGERRIRYFFRPDGKIKIWRPKAHETEHYIFDDHYETVSRSVDERKRITHIRLWGAFHRAEYKDEEGIRKYGRRFVELNDPNLFIHRECFDEAVSRVRSSNSKAENITLRGPYIPGIEIEDIIEIDDNTKWIVDSISVEFQKAEITMELNCRKYVYA